MSKTATLMTRAAVRAEAPMLAHYGFPNGGPCVALCGKRLIGEPAPDSAPLCVVCESLWNGGEL